MNLGAVKSLDRVYQSRAIGLAEDIGAHLDYEIGPESEEIAVEGRVVELAERKTILHRSLSLWFAVRQNMSGVQKLLMAQAAKRTLPVIRLQDSFAEGALM